MGSVSSAVDSIGLTGLPLSCGEIPCASDLIDRIFQDGAPAVRSQIIGHDRFSPYRSDLFFDKRTAIVMHDDADFAASFR